MGSPIQVLMKEKNGKFKLNVDALSSILLKDSVRDTPVVVISIAGDFRKGKSFLMNFILRYLQSDTSDWLKDDQKPLKGFSWRHGQNRDTTGILLWSQPFIVKLKNGKNVAIILMDTQGSFDCKSTLKENTQVFALSTLISSIQVFNLKNNIQGDNLQNLELFTEYGKLVFDEMQVKPFQKLVFLVRDWQCPDENAYGSVGGQKLLENILTVSNDEPIESQKVRQNIKSCFKELSCCLFPHPGKTVDTSPSFNGVLSMIESEFIDVMKEFISSLLDPKTILVKEICGKQVTGKELLKYFKIYTDLFSSPTMPEVNRLLDSTAKEHNETVLKAAKASYTEAMEGLCGRKMGFLNENLLESEHVSHRDKAIKMFDKIKKLGGFDYSKSFRDQLISEIDEAFEHYKAQNNAKKVDHSWIERAKFFCYFVLIPLLAIAICFYKSKMAGFCALVVVMIILLVYFLWNCISNKRNSSRMLNHSIYRMV